MRQYALEATRRSGPAYVRFIYMSAFNFFRGEHLFVLLL